MSQLIEVEELEAGIATQGLLEFKGVNVVDYLENERENTCARFLRPLTDDDITTRERERIPKKTRQTTSWSVNVYRAWAEYRNCQIETVQDKYKSVPTELQHTPAEEINYWLTRFILEVMRGDGQPYPANTLYAIASGLLRHFREDLKRYDLNILSKDDACFQSFRKALDSRMKEMTAAGVGKNENLLTR